MKKGVIFLLIVCFAGTTMSYAQKMEKGMSLGNIGLGLVPGIGLNASFDYGLVDTWGPGIFTIGGFIGFDNYRYNSEIRGTQFLFTPRATYRYAINNEFEVYGTVMIGASFTAYSDIKPNASTPYFATTAGCRYSFAENLAVFGEIGYNISFLNGGLSITF